jgi:hypothetical protein
MERESLNEKWENARVITEMIVFDPRGSFQHDETRQCADGTIMVSGSYSEANEVCPDCGSGNFTAHANRQKKQYAYIRTTPINGYPALLRRLAGRLPQTSWVEQGEFGGATLV